MKKSLFGAVALAAVTVTAVLIGTASAAKPPPAPTNSNCPTSGTKNLKAALNVGASYSGGVYSVQRFGPAAATSLVKYCVYANVAPDALTATAVGADGSAWTASKPGKTFSFSRAGGEPTNLALDGTKQSVGTATFGPQLTTNDIVLHISDADQCFSLYGVVTPTCFVIPGTNPTPVTLTVKKVVVNDNGGTKIATDFMFKLNNGAATSFVQDGDTLHGLNTVTVPSGSYSVVEDATPITGYDTTLSAGCTGTMPAGGSAECTITNDDSPPVCNAGTGNTGAAYNSMPFDVQHCSPASYAFEGNFANEFGDKVTLDTSGGSKIQSMTVDFQSYGCGDSGRWYTADCKTTPGETFTIPGGITAKIYDPAVSLTTPIASSTINPQIPFRPSAILDAGNCPNPPADGYPDDSRWKDPVSGLCNNSLSVPLTFNFAGQPLPSTVVWTVQFNTTHAGYSPIGEAATCVNGGNAPGCGYDSLNVGTKSYDNAPYAGTDVDENTVYISNGNSVWSPPFVSLAPITSPDWFGYRPLAEIDLGT